MPIPSFRVNINAVLMKKYLGQVLLGTCKVLKVVKIIVDSKCTGCETCVNNCPANVYEIQDGKSVPVRVEDCILCRTCESQCPEGAIQVIEVEIEPAKEHTPKVETPKKKTKAIKATKATRGKTKRKTKKKAPLKPAKSRKKLPTK